MYCPINKKECKICLALEAKWKLREIFQKLEFAKGKLDYSDLEGNTVDVSNIYINSKSLTDQEKCALKLLLNGESVKQISVYFNLEYRYFRSWLSKTLYSYFKILAKELKFSFPNNRFQHYYIKDLLEQENYRKESFLSLIDKNTEVVSTLKTIVNYVGMEQCENGELKPKIKISFDFETEYFSSEIAEQIITIIKKMSEYEGWIIVPSDISVDKKIIRIYQFAKTRQLLT